MFTRQHYKAIAEIIKEETQDANQPADGLDGLYATRRAGLNIAQRLARYFTKDNLRFDRTKFLITCGFED